MFVFKVALYLNSLFSKTNFFFLFLISKHHFIGEPRQLATSTHPKGLSQAGTPKKTRGGKAGLIRQLGGKEAQSPKEITENILMEDVNVIAILHLVTGGICIEIV